MTITASCECGGYKLPTGVYYAVISQTMFLSRCPAIQWLEWDGWCRPKGSTRKTYGHGETSRATEQTKAAAPIQSVSDSKKNGSYSVVLCVGGGIDSCAEWGVRRKCIALKINRTGQYPLVHNE